MKQYHIYFVGIGGIGMSGIAELLLNLGYRVSGSDIRKSDITEHLAALGGNVFYSHEAENIQGTDVVVVSSAIGMDNPEVRAARDAGIPVIPRAEMLAEIMRLKYSIVVAGAHGKTSTTSMVAAVLGQGRLDPTVVIGGKLNSIGTNAVLGEGEFIVAEADESDGSFLKFTPAIAVVTNIDREHLDFYENLEAIKDVFLQFIDRIPFYGLAVLCLDNEPIQDILPSLKKRYITYGTSKQADFQARHVAPVNGRTRFSVYHGKNKLGQIMLGFPGVHNVRNALAAVAVGIELGLGFDVIKTALETMGGVQRRMEKKGEVKGVVVIDDYGHHPTEIKATLAAVRGSWEDRRVVVVFQPHRYTRTQALFDDFTRAFYQCDALLLLPVYAAGEPVLEGVNSESLAEGISKHGHKDVFCAKDKQAAVTHLKAIMKQGDLLLTLGAGDVWQVGSDFLDTWEGMTESGAVNA